MRITPNFDRPTGRYLGRRAVYRTYDGARLVGVVERFDGARAVIRFDDGRWAYSGYELELVA